MNINADYRTQISPVVLLHFKQSYKTFFNIKLWNLYNKNKYTIRQCPYRSIKQA